MENGVSQQVSKPLFFAALALAVIVIALLGWNTMRDRPDDGRAIVDAAARYQAAHGIDIKTVPTWSDMWYRYHPEYKGPRPPVKMPVVKINVPPPPGAALPTGPGATAPAPGAAPPTR